MPKLGQIFDLDGVLVETAHLHSAAWRQVAIKMGVNPSYFDTLDLRGVKREKCLDLIFRHESLPAELSSEVLFEKNELYRAAVKATGKAILTTSVKQLLSDLRCDGYKVAIASASRNAELIIEITELDTLVDGICDGRFGGASKPAPDQFIEAARLIDFKPQECVVFEDANVGIEGAMAARCRIIGIGPAVRDRTGLDFWFDSLSSTNLRVLEDAISSFQQRKAA